MIAAALARHLLTTHASNCFDFAVVPLVLDGTANANGFPPDTISNGK
jgi:hypothetical protein